VAIIKFSEEKTFDTDTLKTANLWEDGTAAGKWLTGEGGPFIERPKKELLLVFKDLTEWTASGDQAQDVYDQLDAVKFPYLFKKLRKPA
jgi:hypothetical protein